MEEAGAGAMAPLSRSDGSLDLPGAPSQIRCLVDPGWPIARRRRLGWGMGAASLFDGKDLGRAILARATLGCPGGAGSDSFAEKVAFASDCSALP